MTSTTQDRRRLRIAKSSKQMLALFTEGVSLQHDLGEPIAKLHEKATADRLRLAEKFIDSAVRIRRSRTIDSRAAIGRFYYAMYHAMRAAVFLYHVGDDHEAHSTLYSKIPSDFPNAAARSNDLKDARLRRNEADYDPYPESDAHFTTILSGLAPVAIEFVEECRRYLESKGCDYL